MRAGRSIPWIPINMGIALGVLAVFAFAWPRDRSGRGGRLHLHTPRRRPGIRVHGLAGDEPGARSSSGMGTDRKRHAARSERGGGGARRTGLGAWAELSATGCGPAGSSRSASSSCGSPPGAVPSPRWRWVQWLGESLRGLCWNHGPLRGKSLRRRVRQPVRCLGRQPDRHPGSAQPGVWGDLHADSTRSWSSFSSWQPPPWRCVS